jgi:hypothetical protein
MKTAYVTSIILFIVLAGGAAQENKPSRSLKFSKRQLFVNPYESCAVGDLNRDGQLDIVYGSYWFAGPDFIPRTFRPNGDGRLDLTAPSELGLWVFFNEGYK